MEEKTCLIYGLMESHSLHIRTSVDVDSVKSISVLRYALKDGQGFSDLDTHLERFITHLGGGQIR